MKFFQKGLVLALLLTISALNAQISISIQVNHTVSCHSGSDGSLTAMVTPVGLAYNYNWSNGATTATIDALGAGTYVVTVQNAAGGSAIATAVLAEPEILALSSLTDLPLEVNPLGTVEVETTGGTSPYSYQWTDENNGLFSTEEDLVDAPAGIYMQTCTDANGCVAELSPVTLTAISGVVNATVAGFRAFPNPSSGLLTLEMPDESNLRLQVFNAAGQLVESQVLAGPRATLDLGSLPPGVYLILLAHSGGSSVLKVVVER